MRYLVVAALAASSVLAAPATVYARPADHSQSRGWIYADRAAQSAARWAFPKAAHPFGTVTKQLGCDAQDGSYQCAYNLAIWSSGRWTGRRAPASVEHWSCSGPIAVVVRRTGEGKIQVSSDGNPCRPSGAADRLDAKILFVAAIHRSKGTLGRVSGVHCQDVVSFGRLPFHCYARTAEERVVADIDLAGRVFFGARLQSETVDPAPPGPFTPCPAAGCDSPAHG